MVYISKNSLYSFLAISISVLLLIFPAIQNGYAIIHPDTGAFIDIGHGRASLIGFLTTYPFYLRHLSLSWSNWMVILAQSIVANYVIYLFLKQFMPSRMPWLLHLLVVIFLLLVTPIGFYTSMLAPEIFTLVFTITTLLFLTEKKLALVHKILLGVLIVALLGLNVVHFYFGLFAVLLFTIQIIKVRVTFSRFLMLKPAVYLMLILFGYGAERLIYSEMKGGFTADDSINIVSTYRYVQSGVFDQYFVTNCASGNEFEYQAYCSQAGSYKSTFTNLGDFLFNPHSPVYFGSCKQSGWENCWVNKSKVFQKLQDKILSTEKLTKEHYSFVFANFCKQLVNFQTPQIRLLNIKWQIEKSYREDLYDYLHSNQFVKGFNNKQYPFIHVVFVDVSVLFLLIYLIFYSKKTSNDNHLMIAFFGGIFILNAFYYAAYLGVDDMNQSKVAMILPLGVIVILFKECNKVLTSFYKR